MFRSIYRWIRGIAHWITGTVDEASRGLETDPSVINSTFDEIIVEKKRRIQQFKEAYARLIKINEDKIEKIKELQKEVEEKTKFMTGAKNKAALLVKQMQEHGKTEEEIKQDPEYLKCLNAYQDFKNIVDSKEIQIDDYENEVESGEADRGKLEADLQGLKREIESLQQEKHETVADVIISKQKEEIADILSGVGTDKTSDELSRLRENRKASKAKAKVSQSLAGIDAHSDEREYEKYASVGVADTDFDDLFGKDSTKESPSPLPE